MAITVTDLTSAMGARLYEILGTHVVTGQVLDYEALSSATITITVNGITYTITEDSDWDAETSNTITATAIASALDSKKLLSSFAEDNIFYVDSKNNSDITAVDSSSSESDLIITLTDLATDQKVISCLAFGNDFVDSYLRTRYTLPLESETSDIKTAKINVARYNLISLYRQDLLSENDIKVYEQTVEWLEAIRKGNVALVHPTNSSELAKTSGFVVVGEKVLETDPTYRSATSPCWFNYY